jgi:ABC-type glycerol-3-phosphate transport system substrate-binding protein
LAGLVLGRKKSKAGRLRLAFLLAGMVLVFLLLGCGGSVTTPPTPQGTFQVTVTGTSATTGDSGSAVISVTVPQ